jgi:hypothetical protein
MGGEPLTSSAADVRTNQSDKPQPSQMQCDAPAYRACVSTMVRPPTSTSLPSTEKNKFFHATHSVKRSNRTRSTARQGKTCRPLCQPVPGEVPSARHSQVSTSLGPQVKE